MPFAVGDSGSCQGILWRLTKGTKPDKPVGDMVLEISTDGNSWIKVPMALGLLQAEFYYKNEEISYPSAQGWRGGEMYFDHCREATRVGWEVVAARIARQREAKAKRRRD